MADKTFGSSAGLTILAEDQATPANGMVAHVTSSWNSGYQNGDIKGAFLSDTDDTDLVGGTDADRSVNANDLTVNGTITRTPVATGADLVAYSGFSASNYLEMPYNPDLDFGTGDFCVMGWVKIGGTSGIIFDSRDSSNTEGIVVYFSGGVPAIITRSGSSSSLTTSPDSANDGTWRFVCFTRTNTGTTQSIYIDGELSASDSVIARDITGSDDVSYIGVNYNTASAFPGSLALIRISATAPTAEQIRKIYEDEKVLFQENAQATLYGTSDAVTALAHDPVTDLLHVGTSDGRSVFQGLRRVENTTDAVGTAISASNNLIVEE